METLDNLPSHTTPEEEVGLEEKRVAFAIQAEDMANKHNTSINEVLELYASFMDKQVDRFLPQQDLINIIISSPVTEDLYWKLVESTLTGTKDTMTGLDNRRSFESNMERMVANFKRSRTPFSFIMIDLDNFKSINDTFGHSVGDLVLKAVSAEIKHHARTTDLACRIGGEEMGVIVNGDKSAAAILAERIRQSIAGIDVEKLGIDKSIRESITTSIGVAEYTDGTNYPELIDSADKALYQAKASGKNQVQLA